MRPRLIPERQLRIAAVTLEVGLAVVPDSLTAHAAVDCHCASRMGGFRGTAGTLAHELAVGVALDGSDPPVWPTEQSGSGTP